MKGIMGFEQSRSESCCIAFFDLDRTLLDANSAWMYALYERRLGRVTRAQVFLSGFWFALHHFSLLDVERAYRRVAEHWRGLYGLAIRNEVGRWFKAEVAARLRPGAAKALAEHRARGDRLVLLTNSSAYIAEAACKAFGLDAWLANPILADSSGRLTGELEQPLCYGAGKVARARRWVEEQGLSMDGAYFYTDSFSDLPMLDAVHHPRVVHPDPKLRRIARRRGWPIEDWSLVAD